MTAPGDWHDFAEMIGGASGALTGLLFVAVSLNHEDILKIPALPDLAARTLSILIALVLFCVVGLVPGGICDVVRLRQADSLGCLKFLMLFNMSPGCWNTLPMS